MTRKNFYITIIIGIALCIATLIFAFMCEFKIAFYLMIVSGIYSLCFKDKWYHTQLDGFND